MQGGKEVRYYVRGGFAEAGPDGLKVLAQQAINVADLDRSRLAQDIKDAQEDVSDASDEEARHTAQETLARLESIQKILQQG